MDPRIEHFAHRMAELASGASTTWGFDPVFDELLEAARPSKVQAELIRSRSGGTKLLVAVFGDSVPTLGERDGFTLTRGPSHARWERADEHVLAARESDGRVCEWHRDLSSGIDPAEAHRVVTSIPLLEPFEAIARPGAFVRSIGIERASDGTLRALVGVNLDRDRLAESEAELAARGFAESTDDGLWTDASGRSVVWMGGTVYGYYGAVPERVGAL